MDRGSVKVGGIELRDARESQLRSVRGGIAGLVPQDPIASFNPVLTIRSQGRDAYAAHRSSNRAEADAALLEALALVGLDDAARVSSLYPHQLSGGMRQRVLLALALLNSPSVVVADEPTSALDVTLQRRVLDHLDRLVAEQNLSLLFVTHDLAVAAERADRIVVLREGRVVEHGNGRSIFVHPQHPYTRALAEATPAMVIGRRAGTPESVHAEDADVFAIEAVGIRKTFKQPDRAKKVVVAVDDVTVRLRKGTTLAVVGESGSGKSTLASIILGLQRPDAGHVSVDGQDVHTRHRSIRKELRKKIQPVFQDPRSSLDPNQTVESVLVEALKQRGVRDRTARNTMLAELLEQVSLPHGHRDRYPHELSGGQQQRVAIARAIALEPDVLVCDEPVSALDVIVQEQVLELLRRLQRERGLSVILISHDLGVVGQIAHSVAVMRAGRLVESGTTEQVFTTPRDGYTRELLEAVPLFGRSRA